MSQIYFDHNSTSPIHPKVWNAMCEIRNIPLNPSSTHTHGRMARKIFEECRSTIKSCLKLQDTHELIFTSGCSESNNIALKNFIEYNKICSYLEHSSVLDIIGEGILPISSQGIVNVSFIENYIKKDVNKKVLLSIMYANNEIGTIQPINKICKVLSSYKNNVIIHCDITQALGKVKLNLEGVDLVTFSSHKFGGPVGSGGLLYRRGLDLRPILLGGGQEFGLRSGTPNLLAIRGMKVAFNLLTEIEEEFLKTAKLRNYLEKSLKKISSEVIVFGVHSRRLPNTSSIYMPNVDAETQLMYFDLNGISVSAGSACSSGKVSSNKLQNHLGYPEYIGKNSIRISMGPGNSQEEVNKFVKLWATLCMSNKLN